MALPSSIIQRDTRANQPAATAVAEGTLYCVSDEGLIERSDGATWEAFGATGAIEVLNEGASETSALVSLNFVGDGVAASDDGSGNVTVTIPGGGGSFEGAGASPASGSFTWDNQGSATATNVSTGVMMDVENAGTGWHVLEMNAPATPWNVYMRLHSYMLASNNPQVGIVIRNSTSNRRVNWGFYQTSGPTTKISLDRWTNATTFSARPTDLTAGQPTAPWWRVAYDGTTLTVYLSWDGLAWRQMATETAATFINASGGSVDKIGFGATGVASGTAVAHWFSYFSTTAPS